MCKQILNHPFVLLNDTSPGFPFELTTPIEDYFQNITLNFAKVQFVANSYRNIYNFSINGSFGVVNEGREL